MKKSKICIAVLGLFAASFGVFRAEAQYTPAENFYTAGSSAQFNTFGVAASFTLPGQSGPFCGTHHWSKKNGSVGANTQVVLHDPRSSLITDEPANIWIAWDNNAVNQVSGQGVVCYYASVDSIVGVRAFEARATVSLGSALSGSADASPDLVPLIGPGEPLPAVIYNIVNGSVLNAANTDIRPEDAKFATMRVLTAKGTQVTGRAVTGLGYGPGPVGTAIQDSFSGSLANPVDFSIACGDTDPINSATGCGNSSSNIREYFDVPIGAAPVMVIANVSNTGAGHLGDGNYTNINRFLLGPALEGSVNIIRDLGYTATATCTFSGGCSYSNSSEPIVPLNVFIREPLSGTYNTMEWSVPNALELDASKWSPGSVNGQETGVNPSLSTTCTTKPFTAANCTTSSGNPLWQIVSTGSGNAIRGRAVGTGNMVSSVNNTPDSIGYAFWGFSNYQGKANIKYLTVDGVDPLYSGPSANPNGAGVLPSCTTTGGYATSCPLLPFTNIVNGTYPIWSKYRLMWDPFTASTNIAPFITYYANLAADPVSGSINDMVPLKSLQVFHSHYAQVVQDNGIAYGPNNGFKTGVGETGGDMGGAVLTIQSELEFIADTGGQQVNLVQ